MMLLDAAAGGFAIVFFGGIIVIIIALIVSTISGIILHNIVKAKRLEEAKNQTQKEEQRIESDSLMKAGD